MSVILLILLGLALLTFNRDYIAHLDGVTVIPGGWLNHHWVQLGYQLADALAGFVYSFGGTCIILFLMNLIPGLSLRATEEQEIIGIDDAEIGEFAVRLLILRLEKFLLLCKADYSCSTILSSSRARSLRIPARMAPNTPPSMDQTRLISLPKHKLGDHASLISLRMAYIPPLPSPLYTFTARL